MKNKTGSKAISPCMTAAALFLGVALAAGQVSRADDSDGKCHKHHHGHKGNGAAAQVCKGQASAADKKACFTQLKTQRKAAMEAFSKGFTYTATTPAASAPSGQ